MRKKESGRGGQKERGRNVLQPLQLMSKMSSLLAPLKLGLEFVVILVLLWAERSPLNSSPRDTFSFKVFGSV